MYSFQLVRSIDEGAASIQVVYPSHEDGNDHLVRGLFRTIEEFNRRLSPSRLLFVCPCGMEETIKNWYVEQYSCIEDRLVSTSHISIAPYDYQGCLASDRVISLKQPETAWEITDEFLHCAATDGIAALFDETQTILHAPHGYVFRKPSGQEEDIFVRAGNMLLEPGCMAIFNHLLLRKLPNECNRVYIDSFTILSFALSLQSIVNFFRQSSESLLALTIENTHSYAINPEFRAPNDGSYIVLISASTSGGLARKLITKHQVDPSRIIHLLGSGPDDAKFKGSCIYFRKREIQPNHSSTGTQPEIIEISTEEFLVAQGPPRPVRITLKHVNEKAAQIFHKPFYHKKLQFGESLVHNDGYSPFTIFSETENGTQSPVLEWIKDQLIHELPASVNTLVYADEELSKQVADWIKQELGSHLATISLEEIEADVPEKDISQKPVVVIAYQDPGLELLTRASIALRRHESGYRHYVVCYEFPSSRMEHDRLREDLLRGPNGRKFGWSEFLVLPVGVPALHESLFSYRQQCSKDMVEQHSQALGVPLVNALIKLKPENPIESDCLFLPRTCGSPLVLRHGSIFFPQCDNESVSQIAVYAMVSAAMQYAREPVQMKSTDLPPELRFDSNPFVRSVLDPKMFSRFSDGILQASLLRASRKSELDYCASHDLSRQFTLSCVSVLKNYKNSVGDAAIEYVYSLAKEKIVLRKKDIDEVRKTIQSIPVLKACWDLFRNEKTPIP